MTEKTFTKIMHGFQIGLATIALVCLTLSFGYHLLAGNLNFFTFLCLAAMWLTIHYLFRLSIAEYKQDMARLK